MGRGCRGRMGRGCVVMTPEPDFWVVGNDIEREVVCSEWCARELCPGAVDDVDGVGGLHGAKHWYRPSWEESDDPARCAQCDGVIPMRLTQEGIDTLIAWAKDGEVSSTVRGFLEAYRDRVESEPWGPTVLARYADEEGRI